MKKSLALLLVLTMVFGMMAVPASANFTDEDSITYTQAVEIVEAIGVIDGFDTGDFQPQGDLTREQAAKLIAYLMLGTTKADDLGTTSDVFTDVDADRWSAGYIAYCQNEGILSGRGDGTFDPEAKVTGYEFAKMLLVALGYDAKIEGFTGDQWAINVAKIAIQVGLFDDNDNANFNDPANREEATLYIFNMLLSDMVSYSDKGVEITLEDGSTILMGASDAKAVYEDQEGSDSDKDYRNEEDDVLQFVERFFPDLKVTEGTADASGRPSNKWTYDKEVIDTYAAEADLTYIEAVKGEAIADDIDQDDIVVGDFWEDGKQNTTRVENNDGSSTAYADFFANDVKKIGGMGTEVEVFEDDKASTTTVEEYTIVVTNTYVGKITDWTEENDDDNEEITIKGLAGMTGTYDFETAKFDEDDADDEIYVLFTMDKDGVATVVEAEAVDVEVTSTKGATFSDGDDDYEYSRFARNDAESVDVNTAVTSTMLAKDDEATVYLDMYGNVILITELETSGPKDYAFITGLEVTNSFGLSFEAQIMMADGTVEVVDFDLTEQIEKMTAYEANGTTAIPNGSNDATIKDLVDNLEGTNTLSVTVEQLLTALDVILGETAVEYTEEDGTYEFEVLPTTEAGTIAPVASPATDKLFIDNEAVTLGDNAVKTGADVAFNNDTIFVVDSKTSASSFDVTIYEGKDAVPNLQAIASTAGAYVVDNGFASIVFVVNADDKGANNDDLTFVSFVDVSRTDDIRNGEYFTVNAVVDGDVTTLDVIEGDYANNFALVKNYTTNSDGYADLGTAITPDGIAYGFMDANSGALTIKEAAGKVTYAYNADTELYYIDDAGVIKAGDIEDLNEANDTIVYTLDTTTSVNNLLANVYVFEDQTFAAVQVNYVTDGFYTAWTSADVNTPYTVDSVFTTGGTGSSITLETIPSPLYMGATTQTTGTNAWVVKDAQDNIVTTFTNLDAGVYTATLTNTPPTP